MNTVEIQVVYKISIFIPDICLSNVEISALVDSTYKFKMLLYVIY